MKGLLISVFLIFPVFSKAVTLYTYTAQYGSVGEVLSSTAIGETSEGYWVFNSTAGTSATKETNATFGSDAGRLVAAVWASTGNSKTAFSDVSISVQCGTSSRYYMWARWGGAFVAGNAHPSSGYTAVYEAGTFRIFENDGVGIANNLTQTSYTPADLNNFTMRFVLNGSSLSLYANDILQCSATDATFTTGGIGFTNFSGTLWFDNVIVNNFLIPSTNTIRNMDLDYQMEMDFD